MNKTWSMGQDISQLEISFGDLVLNRGWWLDVGDLISCGPRSFTLCLMPLSDTRKLLANMMDEEHQLQVVMQHEVIIDGSYVLEGQSFVFDGDIMPIKFHFRRITSNQEPLSGTFTVKGSKYTLCV